MHAYMFFSMLIYATSKAPDLFMNEAISMNGQVIYTAIRDKPVMLHTTGHNDANQYCLQLLAIYG